MEQHITIEGMSCQHCVQSVTTTLEGLDGVENVRVTLETGEAVFDTTGPVNMDEVREAILKIGFGVK